MTTHLFDASLYDEAQQLNKRTSREDLTTGTLIDSLAFSRDAVKRLDEEFDDHVAEYKEAMKPYEVDRKALKAVFEGAAKKFEERLLSIFKKQKSLPEETNNGVRLTVALLPRLGLKKGILWGDTARDGDVVGVAVQDDECVIDMIPMDFLLPLDQCIDWKAVQALQKEGKELPPWVEQFDQISLRTKLPEVTE